jgi:phosphatidylglycerophosphate synthase
VKSQRLRHLPNGISAARIIATPVLIGLALNHHEDAFKWLLLAAFISDIADGLIARSLSLTSALGSRLDTLADAVLWIAVIVGIWQFHPSLIENFGWVLMLVIAFWAIEHLAALLRYRKLSSFHTHAMRVSAYLVGIFIMSLFFLGVQPWMLYLAASVSILGSIEELVIILLLPTWTTNVPGLYWVLRAPPSSG